MAKVKEIPQVKDRKGTIQVTATVTFVFEVEDAESLKSAEDFIKTTYLDRELSKKLKPAVHSVDTDSEYVRDPNGKYEVLQRLSGKGRWKRVATVMLNERCGVPHIRDDYFNPESLIEEVENGWNIIYYNCVVGKIREVV